MAKTIDKHKLIDTCIKRVVDNIILKLESTGEYQFSSGTTLELATLTLEFIKRFDGLTSQNMLNADIFNAKSQNQTL